MHQEFIRVEMPALYSKADAQWIQEQLVQLPPSLRRKVALKYSEVYEIEFNAELVSFRQENRARHEANVRLRKFVNAHGRALQGYTTQPPLVGTR
ncbi:hypothetical protein [Klebsiella oxytoca]|uniref:hypothetical protein n=1 Tax=Klebsiella oxytoca TaxID=571 RepID=UPI0022475574|nr:hypothetical protein [Klebsiella oxytoca]MCW9549666.1 hypothetical protein [Klebsiella oxytoca]